jgi:hypothetical protein
VIRFSDLISRLSPAQYAEGALVLFAFVFVVMVARHASKRRAEEHAHAAQLPLADDAGDRRW